MSLPDDSKLTPAMRQYAAFKRQHPECVIFFRMGDFYEVFFEDAQLCHQVLGITLTQRSKGVPMAGVPYHAVESYLRRMIEQGYRVAIADQIQDPREAKGVVERAVTRVLTPGTLIDEDLLDDAAANNIAAILFTATGDDSPAYLALAELSTGSFEVVDLHPADALDDLARLGIDELLYAETATGATPPRIQRLTDHCSSTSSSSSSSAPALTGRPAWHFRHAEAFEALAQHFGVTTLVGFGLADDDPAIGPAGALLRYLIETQAPDGRTDRLKHIRPPRRRTLSSFVTIDAVSLRSLEVERTIRSGDVAGSLLGVLRKCITPMGKRLLRRWLCFPVRDQCEIESRQRAVGAFLDDPELADHFSAQARNIQDISRIAGRITMRRATPRDLVALGRSLAHVRELCDLLADRPAFATHHSRLASVAGDLTPLAATIAEACVEQPPAHLREGGLVRDGFDAQLDEARVLQTDARQWLAQYQRQLVDETGIPSLKVGYNKVFGYYIEVTAAQRNKVPDSFSRKQTLKNAERYFTPELKEFETKVLSASQRALEREQVVFEQLCTEAARFTAQIADCADTIAELDVLACFADRALRRGYVRPQMVSAPIVDIRGGRHPVLEELMRDRFVPNDLQLTAHSTGDPDSNGFPPGERPTTMPNDETVAVEPDSADRVIDRASLAIITGPNMAGKSTYIRQVALLTLMAHTGSYIPAESATIGLTDRIFTRIGASDELHAGRSTFMVEMTETANILHHATAQSLVILDEIGRGTSTLDGLSLAWAIAEQLADIGCRTLFATHYHELTTIADRLESVRNLHVAVREWADEIVFLYRILPGSTDRSYGIHVAKIAGLPTPAIDRARALLRTLEVQTRAGAPAEDNVAERSVEPGTQLGLFTEYLEHPVVAKLRSLGLDDLTPMQAFDLLRRLRQEMDAEKSDRE